MTAAEIVTVHIGQAGINSSKNVWNTLFEEQQISPNGTFQGGDTMQERAHVYYNEAENHRYVPRSVFADLDPESIDNIRASPHAQAYRNSNYACGRTGSGGNFAKARYTETDLHRTIEDIVRREAERCDLLAGFQIFHSIAGGTGSGLTAGVLNTLRMEYCDRIVQSFTMFPGATTSSSILDPYNAILSCGGLVELVDMTVCLDNESMFDVAGRLFAKQGGSENNNNNPGNKSLEDANKVLAKAVSNVTASFRFPGQLNCNLRKLALNLIPFPRVHFLTVSLPSISDEMKQYSQTGDANLLVSELFDATNSLCSADPRHGRYLTGSVSVRGRVSTKVVEESLLNVQNKNSSYFVEWIPSNLKCSICDIPPTGDKVGASLLANNTTIQGLFKRISEQFTAMFRKKAFLHSYLSEGMDEMEFTEAESNVNDLISEYQGGNDMSCDDDEDFDDDDDDY